MAYPTPYLVATAPIYWWALFPTPSYGTLCCIANTTTSPVPSHYPFPSSTGSTDPADPTGWLYEVTPISYIVVGSSGLSSLFAPATINSATLSCPHPLCETSQPAEGASAVQAAGALLATSTVHVTGTFSSTGTATPNVPSAPEIDPDAGANILASRNIFVSTNKQIVCHS